MVYGIILCAAVLLLSVVSSKLLYRFGVPSLLIFLGLGMLFGSDGIFGIQFDNFEIAKTICSVGLIFIMFYGGFGTNWKMAKPVATKAVTMSTLGVVITALVTGLFCRWILHTTYAEGFLIGSVLASTDAASVFNVLRSRKLSLKGGLASLLEIESGSNDPIAYMLTIFFISMINQGGGSSVLLVLAKQILFGLAIGFAVAFVSVAILKRINFEIDGLYPIFVTAIALLGYGLCEWTGGNGYLSVYIVGLVIGNSKILHKRSLVHFFDGISWLMQIMLFFTLGLLSFPSQISGILLPGILIALVITFIARPVATFSILSWFRVPFKSQLFVSWVGLRGAASIVFAIYAVTSGGLLHNDIFHIVFLVSLLSVSFQGSLIPLFAKKLNLVEKETNVLKTFNDYQDDLLTQLREIKVTPDSPWAGKTLLEADIPEEILIVMIKRAGSVVLPKGSTKILPGDSMVLTGRNLKELDMKKTFQKKKQ